MYTKTSRPDGIPSLTVQVAGYLIGLIGPAVMSGRATIAIVYGIALVVGTMTPIRLLAWPKFRDVLLSRWGVVISIVCLAVLPSFFWTPDLYQSATTFIRTIFYVLAGVWLWALICSEPRLQKNALAALSLGSCLLGAVAVLSILYLSELSALIRGQGFQEVNARLLLKESAAVSVLLVPALLMIAYQTSGRHRTIAFTASLIMISLIFLTSNRAAIAGLCAQAIVFSIIITATAQSRRLKTIAPILTILFLIGIAVWLIDARAHYLREATADQYLLPVWLVDAQRQAIWGFAMEAGEDHRLFGLGINAIDSVEGAYDFNEETRIHNLPSHPHNWVIEILVETGVIGFMAIITAVLGFSVKLLREVLRTLSPELISSLAIWVGFWASSLFNFSIWSSWWIVVAISLFVICYTRVEEKAPARA